MQLNQLMQLKMMRQIIRYGFAGGLNTAITFLAYALMVSMGLAYQLANLLAWILGIICGYFLNLLFVFEDKENPVKANSRQFVKFSVMYGFSFTLSSVALMGLVESGLVGPVKAQFIVIPLIVVVNFISSKFLVFKNSTR